MSTLQHNRSTCTEGQDCELCWPKGQKFSNARGQSVKTKFSLQPNADMRLLVIVFLGSRALNRENVDRAIAQIEVTFDLNEEQQHRLVDKFKWVTG